MFRRTIGAIVTAAFVLSVSAGAVLGGQPGASCGDTGATLNPPGFDSGGFAKAEAVYAGSEGTKSLAHANSADAVSQYDIACVHFTAAHS
jgi:hypothetical protein